MIVYFETEELQEIYETPLKELRGKRRYPSEVLKQYKKLLVSPMDENTIQVILVNEISKHYE